MRKLARTIAFVGNCQMQALQILYDRFAGGYTREKTVFLPSYKEIDAAGKEKCREVSLVVEQVQAMETEAVLPEILELAERILVPLVSAAFLWPFAGEQHPKNVSHRYLEGGPYPSELGDAFLNRLIQKSASSDHALEQYSKHLFSEQALDRRYEISIDRQRRRDEICGFSIANEIEKLFRTEPLFFSPHHPGLRVSRTFAAQCFARLGAPRISLDLLNAYMRRSPFPQDQLPIHPAGARHFKLGYVNAYSTYAFRGEGRFSWEQWVRRYVRCCWEPDLYEAAAIAEADAARARDLSIGVLERLPDSPMAHLSLAKALLRLCDTEGAALQVGKAIGLNAENPAAWRVAAQIAMQRRRPDEARGLAASAVFNDPSNIENLGLLAKIQEDMKDFASAEWTRRKIVLLKPSAPDHRSALGTALLHQKGKIVEALAEYSRTIELDPRHAGAHFGSSVALVELGRAEEAIKAVHDAIAANPNVPLYHSHLGHLFGRAGRRNEAIGAFLRALKLDPADAGIHNIVGDLMWQEGQRDPALQHVRRAVALEPETVRFQLRLGQMLDDNNSVPEAISVLNKACALRPADAGVRLRLGLLYARNGRLDQAVSELEEALQIDPRDAEAAYELSRLLECQGDFDGGRVAIERALAAKPGEAKLVRQQQRLASLKEGVHFARVPSLALTRSSETVLPAAQLTTPGCLVYTNFSTLNPAFAQHHLDGLYVERERYLPAVSLGQLSPTVKLVVPNGEDFILFCDNKVADDQVRPKWGDQELRHARDKCTREAVIEGPAVLIGRFGIRTWGHWLGELLPKLLAVELMMPQRFRYVLPDRMTTDPIHRTALEALEYYGIGVERLALVAAETIYSASNLHIVTPAWSTDHMIHPMAAELMRTYGRAGAKVGEGPERVALLRRRSRTRNLVNLEQIQQYLERRHWAIADVEVMNFPQQVALFRNATSIISVLGSGLTGLIYSPRDVKVMTLAPSHWGDLFFFALMQERNARLADIRGTSVAETPDALPTASFSVDLGEIETGLTKLDEG
jgi:tetratricopeptide (TPR) repeat protein/capsular polysaccharide biosynthesis protein